jgi:threonine/homoserine/homoserine lactone efflux protein
MIAVAISVILLGLLASFSPVVIAAVASQLTRTSPVARAIAVLAGVALATALFEIMALGLLTGLKALLSSGNEGAIRIGFDLVCGVLLIWIVLRLWLRRRPGAPPLEVSDDDPADESQPRRLKRLFGLGFTMMILNAKAFLLIAGAVTQIRALNTWLEVAILLVVLYVVVNLFPSMPLAAYLISPRFAEKIPELTEWSIRKSEPAVNRVKSVQRWLFSEHLTLIAALTLCAGLLLFARGIWLLAG